VERIKGQNQRRDGVVDFGVAGNGHDSWRFHIHSDVSVW
jgi:hypothetical protein